MTDLPTTIREATAVVLKACRTTLSLLPSDDMEHVGTVHLSWMCDQALAHLDDWPIDKLNRWLGYIQGVMTARGFLDPDEERERTRPIFHAAYRAEAEAVPETVERKPAGPQA